MEELEDNNNSISTEQLLTVITNVIQSIFNNLFSSIDNTIYNLLDSIVILTSTNVIDESIKQIFFSNNFNILILINILIGFIFIYRIIRIVTSYYTNQETEFILLYILKSIIIVICANNCLFICESLINFNYLITEFLLELGEHLFNSKISFLNFVNSINVYVSTNDANIFSIDGIIKSIITFGSISLLISYIIRFILIKILIICSPFFIICLLQEDLQQYFFNWLKYFLILLITQNFIIIVLYIPHILNFENTTYSKFLIIGSILLLFKLNSYIQEILGGFNFSNNSAISSSILKSIKKGGN